MAKAKNNTITKIPSVSLSQAQELILTALRAEKFEREKTKRKIRQVIALLGPPGQGKSSIVEQVVAQMDEEDRKAGGKGWNLVSYRLGQCDPTDLKGVPVYGELFNPETGDKTEICKFAGPSLFPYVGQPGSANGKNVLIFLDELPQAVPTIQNLAANIIDGVVGDNNIDFDRSFTVVAGNRADDISAVFEIPRNVVNRVSMINVTTSVTEWETWAFNSGVNPYVIGFVKANTHCFNEEVPTDATPYATPRSWDKVSAQMNSKGDAWFDKNGIINRVLACATIGDAAGIKFYQFCLAAKNAWNLDDIMAGKKVEHPGPENKDALFSLVLEATYRINKWVKEVNAKMPLCKDTKEYGEAFVRLLGKKQVESINNIYHWLYEGFEVKKVVDPAWAVLINKYQSRDVVESFRSVILTHPDFKLANQSYMKIHAVMVKK